MEKHIIIMWEDNEIRSGLRLDLPAQRHVRRAAGVRDADTIGDRRSATCRPGLVQ